MNKYDDGSFKWLWKLNWTALFSTKMLANWLVVFLYPLNTFHMSPQPALATLAVTVIGRLAPMFCDHLELILYFLVLMLLDKEGFSLFNMSILTSSWLRNIHLKHVSAIHDHFWPFECHWRIKEEQTNYLRSQSYNGVLSWLQVVEAAENVVITLNTPHRLQSRCYRL